MRKILSGLLLLVALVSTASAQVASITIQNAGVTSTPNRSRLNFVNGGCVDNPATAAKDCTFAGGGGTVTSVTATLPLSSSGGATPNITLAVDSTLSAGTTLGLNLAASPTLSGVWTFSNPIATPGVDVPSAGALSLGTGNATSIAIAKAGVTTTVGSNLIVSGPLAVTPAASTGAVTRAAVITPGANTALTASTEYTGFLIDTSTQQFATGALATERYALFTAPTISFVGASTLTNAATLAISNAPIAGTNATITNRYALWTQAGNALIDANGSLGINIAPTYALHTLSNGVRYQMAAEASGVSITNNSAAGTTRLDYLVIEKDAQGNATVGTYISTVTANATVNNSINFTMSAGTKTVDVYRFNSTAAGNAGTTGSIALALTTSPASDTGQAASAYTLPVFNATAQAILDSPMSIGTSVAPTTALTLGGSLTASTVGQVGPPTYVGTGANNAKNNTYFIVPYNADGSIGAAGTTSIFSGGPTQLSTVNYTTISWTPVSGAIYYDVVATLRQSQDSAGGITAGLIGSKITAASFRDTGIIPTTYAQNVSINPGTYLRNTLASTVTQTQQVSPGIQFESHAWKSNATAADQANYGYTGFRGLTGGAQTLGEFYFSLNQSGSGTWNDVLKFTNVGGNNMAIVGVSQLTLQSSASQALILNGSASVLFQVASASQVQVLSGGIFPTADSGGQSSGSASLRWNQGFFGKSISVLPTTVAPIAAVNIQGGDIIANILASTTISTITQGGTPGATTYSYIVVAKDAFSNKTLGSAVFTTNTGNATLTGTNTNIITWTTIPGPGSGGSSGQISYDVIRYASGGSGGGSGLGSIAIGNLSNTFTDTGQGTSAYTAPTYNATGDISSDGKIIGNFLSATQPALTVPTGVTNFTTADPPPVISLTAGAHLALKASTEYTNFLVDLSATEQFATGALTTQRSALFKAPTYSFVGASTITKAATVAIDNAVQAGTNATITSPYALWVQAGQTELDGTLLRTTRVSLGAATALVAGDFALSAGWGSTASKGSILGTDGSWTMTVTTGGINIAANPTIALTFKDGTWTTAPVCIVDMNTTSDATNLGDKISNTESATVLTITFNGTPITANTYTFSGHCTGVQ